MADVISHAHSHSHSHHFQLSLLSSRFKISRFDESTLRILELLLSSKNVEASLNLRKQLNEFLRSQSLIAIREVADKSIHFKLRVLDFFVHAFAIVDDLQSCLALRYEGLILRDSSTISHPDFLVSSDEWMKFAEDAFDNAFYSVAAKACENALLSLDGEVGASHCDLETVSTIDRIQRLHDVALKLSSTHSVQAQASEYLKKKTSIVQQSSLSTDAECPASISFRNGIKLQNARNLMRLRSM